jgi:hypothetical protein
MGLPKAKASATRQKEIRDFLPKLEEASKLGPLSAERGPNGHWIRHGSDESKRAFIRLAYEACKRGIGPGAGHPGVIRKPN